MSGADQASYSIRFDWGPAGLEAIGAYADAIVIVDLFSFTTTVDIAVARGAQVYPCGWRDGSADAIARRIDGVVAGTPAAAGASLSPSSMSSVRAGTRIVVESINGSALVHAARGGARVFAACLRNAAAVAAALRDVETVAVIAAGERWPDGSLRPAIEDLLGAGAVIARLRGHVSPEAEVTASAYMGLSRPIEQVLRESVSGREKLARGLADDVVLAAASNVSRAAPELRDGAFGSIAAD